MYATPRRTTPREWSEEQRIERARLIWAHSCDAAGTPVQQYLRGRSINITHPLIKYTILRHRVDNAMYPVMVAAVLRHGVGFVGVHRTFLALDPELGMVVKADIEPNKASMGCTLGGAVRLGPKPDPDAELIVCEGIEDGLSIAQDDPKACVWVSLGVSNLAQVALPDHVRRVIIAADNDDAGRRAAVRAAWAYERLGREVSIRTPNSAKDFNEVLCRG
jgi:DNA primase